MTLQVVMESGAGQPPAPVAVYDLGGGTFDATLVGSTPDGSQVLGVPETLEWVGGIDLDEALMDLVNTELGGVMSGMDPSDPAQALTLQRIRPACERAKEELARRAQATIWTGCLPGQPADAGTR
ncbi:Hsp70 family protein [Kineosporia corallincola]|uniref:Hsp70 family protein n=1 Tax=Kineosporia corallincola TaxID=2835133 RepID=UPI0027E0F5E1|nr:Hsp70 family protein [Kineosporia corallincola]